MIRSLTVLAAAACLCAPAFADQPATDSGTTKTVTVQTRETVMDNVYPSFERPMGHRFYSGYRLTPLDYRRLRADGYTRDEAYMIANAAHFTGIDTDYFVQRVHGGMYARQLSVEFSLLPGELTRVLPEWRTQEWADAVHEPVFDKQRLSVWY